MKNFTIPLLLIINFILSACDKIDNPLQDASPNPKGSDTTSSNLNFTNYSDTSKSINKILLEDFTGHTCANCPSAAQIAEQLKTTLGDTLVVVSVHAGYFAKPQNNADSSFKTDFRTIAGEAYNTNWGIDQVGNPNGLINRSTIGSNSLILSPSNWSIAINELIASHKNPKIKLEIGLVFDSISRKLDTYVKAKALTNLTENLKLVVYLAEDKIADWQKDGSLKIPNYEHNHVLRDVLNGTWGDDFIPINFLSGSAVSTLYSNYTVNPSWKTTEIQLIAYLYNSNTLEIEQVEYLKLKK